jgi:hypothetical protein
VLGYLVAKVSLAGVSVVLVALKYARSLPSGFIGKIGKGMDVREAVAKYWYDI